MIRISGESSTPASKIIGAAQNDSYKKEAMDSVQEKLYDKVKFKCMWMLLTTEKISVKFKRQA